VENGGASFEAAGIPESSMQAQQFQPGQQGEGAHRKRRRRRRGRRGQGNGEHPPGQVAGQEQQSAPENGGGYDRFGAVPDEIDTTPREDSGSPSVVPNAASTPEWSLTSRASGETAPVTPVESAPAEQKPTKRGWWQRAFKAE
jgi:hypothetical protein